MTHITFSEKMATFKMCQKREIGYAKVKAASLAARTDLAYYYGLGSKVYLKLVLDYQMSQQVLSLTWLMAFYQESAVQLHFL